MTRRPRFIALIFSMILLGVWTKEARAQLTPQQKQEIHAHYQQATRAYDLGKYQEAIDEYQKVYEIDGDPVMLYNIGQAYRLNDQPQESIHFYRRYLQRSPEARNKDDVERKIASQEKLIEERRKAAAAVAPPPPKNEAPPPPKVEPPPPPFRRSSWRRHPPPPPAAVDGAPGGRLDADRRRRRRRRRRGDRGDQRQEQGRPAHAELDEADRRRGPTCPSTPPSSSSSRPARPPTSSRSSAASRGPRSP